MSEQEIIKDIDEVLTGDIQKLALDFVAYLKAEKMQCEKGTGYWADKSYWLVKHKNEYLF